MYVHHLAIDVDEDHHHIIHGSDGDYYSVTGSLIEYGIAGSLQLSDFILYSTDISSSTFAGTYQFTWEQADPV